MSKTKQEHFTRLTITLPRATFIDLEKEAKRSGRSARDLAVQAISANLATRKGRRASPRRSGRAPFGFTKRDGAFVADPRAAEAIVIIRRMRVSVPKPGHPATLREVAAELEKRGIPAPGGGRRWHPQTVARVASRARKRSPNTRS